MPSLLNLLLLLPLLVAPVGEGAPARSNKRIAITFDDVPRGTGASSAPEERTRRLIAALSKAGVEQAAFFVTNGNLDQPDRSVASGHVMEAAEYDDWLARRAPGRSPAQVLLLQETDLAALFIDDLVQALRGKGWRVVTADEAFADPIASAAPDVPAAQGTLTEALAWKKCLSAPRWSVRNNIRLATALFRTRVLKEIPVQ